MEAILGLLLKVFEFIKPSSYPSKICSDIFERDNVTHPTVTGLFFRFYLVNHLKQDLKIYVQIHVKLNNEILQNNQKFDVILIPSDKRIEIYSDNIAYILHDNLTGKNLSDPKDHRNRPLQFFVSGTIIYKKIGWFGKEKRVETPIKTLWECSPPLWKLNRVE